MPGAVTVATNMPTETCTKCGLVSELCVCEDVSRSQATLYVTVEERKYNDVTLIEGVAELESPGELESELKTEMACGGTLREDVIELQGDHRGEIEDELRDRGFDVA